MPSGKTHDMVTLVLAPPTFAAAYLLEGGGGLGVRHGDADDLAALPHHLLDLPDGALNVRGVRLRHRLHGDGRAAADQHVLDPDLPGFPHIKVPRTMVGVGP